MAFCDKCQAARQIQIEASGALLRGQYSIKYEMSCGLFRPSLASCVASPKPNGMNRAGLEAGMRGFFFVIQRYIKSS
jgi:hypothetical protein